MTALAVFLHTVMVISLGPLLAGVIRVCTSGGGFGAFLAPMRTLSAGLRDPGQPPLGQLALLALAIVAGLLIPLFSPDAVLGFLGDGFAALMLLTGLSMRVLPVRAATVLAAAAALWALGTLTGSTDLAQAFAFWQPSVASWLVFLGLALGVAPLMVPGTPPDTHPGHSHAKSANGRSSTSGFCIAAGDTSGNPGELDTALTAWTRSTLQLGWLALGMMAFPLGVPLMGWASLALALAVFGVKLVVLGGGFAAIAARWPKLPLTELGLAFSLLALGLAKLGI